MPQRPLKVHLVYYAGFAFALNTVMLPPPPPPHAPLMSLGPSSFSTTSTSFQLPPLVLLPHGVGSG